MSDAVKVGFVPFSAAAARHSGGVLRRHAEIRRGDAQGAGGGGRYRQAGGGDQPVQGQERLDARYSGAGGTQGRAPDRGRRRQGCRHQGEGFSQVRRRDGRQAQCRQRMRSPSSPNCRRGDEAAMQAAAVASGIRLRAYKFDRYKTKKKDGENGALARRRFDRGRRCRRRAKGLRAGMPTSSTASSWRANSSTSRRTCCIRSNSRAAPAS